MDMDDVVIPILVVRLFIGLPWLIFHYITKWKTGGDADLRRREAARRAARRRAPPRRPAVHDRTDHDRRKPQLAPAVPARPRREPAPARGRRVRWPTIATRRERSNQPQTFPSIIRGLFGAAGEPHPLLSRQAQRQDCSASAPGSPTTPASTSASSGCAFLADDVHERRLDPALLLHRRRWSLRRSRASSS